MKKVFYYYIGSEKNYSPVDFILHRFMIPNVKLVDCCILFNKID